MLLFFLGAPASVSVSAGDSGAGSEGVSASIIAAISDSGTGGNATSASVADPAAESGSGSDSASIGQSGGNVALPGSDAGSGSDSASIGQSGGNQSLSSADSAAGAEGVALSATGSVSVAGSDSGAGSDTQSLSVGVVGGALPDYDLVWEPDTVLYAVGDRPPWQWRLTRTDGGLVPVPSAAAIDYLLPDGTAGSVMTLYSSSSVAALSLTIGGVAPTLTLPGVVVVTIHVTLTLPDGTPSQVRSSTRLILVV